MVHRDAVLLLIVILGLPLITHDYIAKDVMNLDAISPRRQHVYSYSIHAPFNITSNTDFETQGWPGNGSETNPYRIQNLNVTSSNSTCIWIMNTTLHFIVEGCVFVSPVLGYVYNYPTHPVTLTNVSNGRILGNIFEHSLGAISGYSLSNCNISDNSFKVSYQGISLRYSNSTIIANNSQGFEPCNYGISVYACRNCTLSQNEFLNITSLGLDAWNNYQVNIVENTFTSDLDDYLVPWDGIRLYGGQYCRIQRNVLTGFGSSGINISGWNNSVEYNTISECNQGLSYQQRIPQ